MNMISQLRSRIQEAGLTILTADEYNQLQREWITRVGAADIVDAERDSLRAVNAELLAALKGVVASWGSGFCEGESLSFDKARAAIDAALAARGAVPAGWTKERENFAARWEHLAYMHARGIPMGTMAHYIANPERLDYSAELHREHTTAAAPRQVAVVVKTGGA